MSWFIKNARNKTIDIIKFTQTKARVCILDSFPLKAISLQSTQKEEKKSCSQFEFNQQTKSHRIFM